MKYFLCIPSVLFLAVSVSIAQEQEDFIFFYDFNAEKAGEAPPDPWKPTAMGEIVVEEFPSADDKSVRVEDSGSGGGMTLILDPMLEAGIVSLEFRWLLKESSGSDVEILYVMNQQAPDNWSGACIAMVPGKKATLEFHDGAWILAGQIENEVWHDLKVVMHLDDNEYDFYYDGEELVKGAAFRNYAGNKGISKFNVGNVGNGGTTFVTYFDDIILYEGDTKPVSVEPISRLSATWGLIKSRYGFRG